MTTAPPAVALDAVSVAYGSRRVLAGVDLSLCAGRLVVVAGPNGAGKSTLARAILGLVPLQAGRVRLGGRPIGDLADGERARRLAYLPQGHQIHWPMSVADVIAIGRQPHGMRDPAGAVARLIRELDLAAIADRPVTTLSGGERARVALARALAVEAPILIADEPTAALDPHHQLAIMDHLRRVAGEGALVIAVMHDFALAARYADDVVLIVDGHLAAVGPADSVLRDRVLEPAFGVGFLEGERDGRRYLVPWNRSR